MENGLVAESPAVWRRTTRPTSRLRGDLVGGFRRCNRTGQPCGHRAELVALERACTPHRRGIPREAPRKQMSVGCGIEGDAVDQSVEPPSRACEDRRLAMVLIEPGAQPGKPGRQGLVFGFLDLDEQHLERFQQGGERRRRRQICRDRAVRSARQRAVLQFVAKKLKTTTAARPVAGPGRSTRRRSFRGQRDRRW
jgi:hypothetical protein